VACAVHLNQTRILGIILAMPNKKSPKSRDHDELTLFQEALQGVEPLQQDKMPPFRKPRRPRPLPPETEPASPSLADMDIETAEELLFVRPGVQKRVMRELQRGRIPPADSLDLHGLRVRQAEPLLIRFLKQAQQQQLRCVLIIHGKGRESAGQQPVLKQKTNQWLRQLPFVLAFCSAAYFDGGTGATYVLLSRKRAEETL